MELLKKYGARQTMVMDGYVAYHQVYTIFQGLPRQVPPDHMCHPWPISRVGSRAQNFALKSQISLPNKFLRTLWTFFPLRPIMGHEGVTRSADFFSAEYWILCPRIGCIFFYGLCFSRERLRRVLRKKAAVVIHLHTFTSHPQTC